MAKKYSPGRTSEDPLPRANIEELLRLLSRNIEIFYTEYLEGLSAMEDFRMDLYKIKEKVARGYTDPSDKK